MARTLDAGLAAAIVERGTSPGWLIEIGTTTPLRYSTRGTLSYGGYTWVGGAVLSGVEFSGDLGASVTLELPNTDNAASALALTDLLRDVAVTLYAYYGDPGYERELLADNSDFGAWPTVARVTVPSGNNADPDGGSAADVIRESDGLTGLHYVAQTVTGLDDNGLYVFSVSLKQINRQYAWMQITNKAGTALTCRFDLDTGDILSSSSALIAKSATTLGDDWWRCVLTADIGSGATTPLFVIGLADAGSNSITGLSAQDAIYAYNATLRRGTAAAYAEELATLAIDAVEAINSTRVEFSLSSIAEGASRLPDVLVGPPLCNHIPPAGTVIRWGWTTVTLERK